MGMKLELPLVNDPHMSYGGKEVIKEMYEMNYYVLCYVYDCIGVIPSISEAVQSESSCSVCGAAVVVAHSNMRENSI